MHIFFCCMCRWRKASLPVPSPRNTLVESLVSRRGWDATASSPIYESGNWMRSGPGKIDDCFRIFIECLTSPFTRRWSLRSAFFECIRTFSSRTWSNMSLGDVWDSLSRFAEGLLGDWASTTLQSTPLLIFTTLWSSPKSSASYISCALMILTVLPVVYLHLGTFRSPNRHLTLVLHWAYLARNSQDSSTRLRPITHHWQIEGTPSADQYRRNSSALTCWSEFLVDRLYFYRLSVLVGPEKRRGL